MQLREIRCTRCRAVACYSQPKEMGRLEKFAMGKALKAIGGINIDDVLGALGDTDGVAELFGVVCVGCQLEGTTHGE